jgi:hypothetical protein
MELTKNDPAVIEATAPAPAKPEYLPGTTDLRQRGGVHDAGVEARKAKSASDLQAALAQRQAQQGLGTTTPPPVLATATPVAESENAALERAAQMVLEEIGSMEGDFGRRLKIVREERHFTAYQLIFSWLGYILDRSLHLEVPLHPVLSGNFHGHVSPQTRCEICGCMFTPTVPGQRFDSPECGAVNWRKHEQAEAAKRKAEEDERRARRLARA